MKRLKFNLLVSKIIYVIVFICNLVLPWYKGVILKISFFNVLDIIFWTYGLASHHGYFLKPVTTPDSSGKVIYEVDVPIKSVGFARIAQIIYLVIFKRATTDWRFMGILLGIDVLYTAFILLDKSNYYYESEDMRDDA